MAAVTSLQGRVLRTAHQIVAHPQMTIRKLNEDKNEDQIEH